RRGRGRGDDARGGLGVRAGADQRLRARERAVPVHLREMIQLEGVSKRLGTKQVLEDLSLELPTGLTTVILGRSGTGKSVLLKHIIGLMHPDEGRIVVDGEDIASLDE